MAFLPALFALGAAALAVLVVSVEPDEWSGPAGVLFPGSSESARAILGAIAGSMITLAGLVFSITMLVLQLSSSQYSPRVLRTFLADRSTHLALAAFVGTFTYAVVVLRSVGTEAPGLATTLALLAVLATVGVFVQFVSHMSGRIRVSSIVSALTDETLGAIERHGDGGRRGSQQGPPPPPRSGLRRVDAPRRGYVVFVDLQRLLADLGGEGYVEVVPRVGDFVSRGSPLLRVAGVDPSGDERLVGTVELRGERDLRWDPAFGVRQLVDIAERALSPSTNDPSTAVQVVDHLQEVLRVAARSGTMPSVHRDDDGVVRVVTNERGWAELLHLGTDGVVRHGRDEPEVVDALQRLCREVLDVAEGHQRAPVLELQRRLGPELRATAG